MPPHCDTLDGPVVKAARKALEDGNVNLILPYAPKKAEQELRNAFDRVMRARRLGNEASELADHWFFETAVRLHREGEGAPYTGLKPAGLDVGPVLPKAERAIEEENMEPIHQFLSQVIHEELEKRMRNIISTKDFDVNDVDAAREHIEAELDFELFSHHVYTFIKSGGGHGVGEGESEEAKTGHAEPIPT